jgi:NTP pyrophosphatase (non-canonical NTP hydrolase)
MDEETKEILIILQEECAEVIQSISKCYRFGPDQMKLDSDTTNMQSVQKELGDVLAMIELLTEKNIGVTIEGLENDKKLKFEKLKRFSNININK